MSECIVCGASVLLKEQPFAGELIECAECGTALEVITLDPLALAEAPSEEEDWGQ